MLSGKEKKASFYVCRSDVDGCIFIVLFDQYKNDSVHVLNLTIDNELEKRLSPFS